ncbi:MAG: outer membrane beta-barrel protein [Parachlamydiaceae bacterium]|nr:outer membrane beta-barrel protein [Parachlamydiaceae bacterium]
MLGLFSKNRLFALLALFSLNTMNSSLTASECCNTSGCGRFYVGAFGGGLRTDSTKMYQMGTAFFREADQGGPLAVFARGKTKKTSSGLGGIQLGYEWANCSICCSDWSVASALELEAFWYSHKIKGHLINATDPLRLPEHDFAVSFHTDSNVYLANVVFSFNSCCFSSLSPYFGLGVGASRISASGAKSIQVDPIEEGVNHFNSKRSDTTWAFAAQAKVGLRYNFCNSFHIFGEYRYLYVDYSNFIFGSTVYSFHAPTSQWDVKVKKTTNNALVFGIQYDL